VIATIAALRTYAVEIRDAEVTRALARLENLSARDAFVVRALAQRIVDELLRGPMTVLEVDAEGANMAHILRQLFQLEPEAEQSGFSPAPLCRTTTYRTSAGGRCRGHRGDVAHDSAPARA
jgi:hypothetical protein